MRALPANPLRQMRFGKKDGRAMTLLEAMARPSAHRAGVICRSLLVGVALLLALSPIADASILQIQPSTNSIPVGGILNVDIRISGLGVFSSPSLAVFDFTINVPSQFGAASPSFGDPVLGDQLSLSGFGSFAFPTVLT